MRLLDVPSNVRLLYGKSSLLNKLRFALSLTTLWGKHLRTLTWSPRFPGYSWIDITRFATSIVLRQFAVEYSLFMTDMYATPHELIMAFLLVHLPCSHILMLK